MRGKLCHVHRKGYFFLGDGHRKIHEILPGHGPSGQRPPRPLVVVAVLRRRLIAAREHYAPDEQDEHSNNTAGTAGIPEKMNVLH